MGKRWRWGIKYYINININIIIIIIINKINANVGYLQFSIL